MNGKTSKLISRFCHMTKRSYHDMKVWYEGLPAPLRAQATKMMREQVGEHREPVQS